MRTVIKTVLNDKQKDFLFETIFKNDLREIYKIFDTTSINYLKKQKISLGEPNTYGWVPLIVGKIEYTSLNFPVYKEWNKIWELA